MQSILTTTTKCSLNCRFLHLIFAKNDCISVKRPWSFNQEVTVFGKINKKDYFWKNNDNCMFNLSIPSIYQMMKNKIYFRILIF